MTRLVLFELFVTNLLLFEHQKKNQKKMLVSRQFSGPRYGVTKYGSGEGRMSYTSAWSLARECD